MSRKIIIVAALSVAAYFTMPVAVNASIVGHPGCVDACGTGGGDYPPGCNDAASNSSSGDMQSFDASRDPSNGDLSNVSMTYDVPGPGTWNVSYNWQTVDSSGNDVDSGQFSGDAFDVPADGGSYTNSVDAQLPAPPTGGAIYVNVYGTNDFGQVISGAGGTVNFDCSPMF